MDYFYGLLLMYKYEILLPLDIIEGPMITIIASFLASQGLMNIYLVFILAVFGNVIGDSLYYLLGRWGRGTFIKKYGKYVGLTHERIIQTEEHYKQHLLKTLFLSKVVNAGIEVFLVGAGMSKVDYKKFVGGLFLVEIPKNLLIVLIGYYFGEYYNLIAYYLHDYFLAAFVAAITGIVAYLIYKLITKYSKKLNF